jgi:putative aldouronate transport system permease protein
MIRAVIVFSASLTMPFLTVILVAVLYPLVYVVSASFSEPAAVTAGEVFLWPVRPTLIGYEKIFEHPAIMKGFANSVFYAVVGSTVNVFMTMLAAYPLSRKDLPDAALSACSSSSRCCSAVV